MHIFKRIFLFLSLISLIACDTSYDNSVSNNDNNKNTEQNQNTPEPSNPTENDDKPIVTDPEDNVTFVNKTDLIVKVYSDSLKTNLLTTVNTGETFSCNADINATGNVFYYTYYFVLKDVLDYIDIDTVLIPYGTGQGIVTLSSDTMTTVNIVTPTKLGTNKNIIILENQSSSAIALTQANTELQPENKTSTLLNENEQGIYLLDLNNNLADYKVSDAGENISLREIDTADKGYIYYFTYNGKEAILNIKTLLQSSEEKNVIKLNANYLDVIKKFSAEEYKVIISGTMDDSTLSNIATAIKNNTFVKINLDLSCATELTTIGNSAFKDCSNLTSITIPDSVTKIGKEAFYSCYSLTSIIIPDSVTSIGDDAFYNCSNLTSVTIPDSVTSISNSAFSSCDNLTSITIPDSVTSIGDYAFSSCDNLTSITIPGSVTSIGNSAFSSCDNLTSITIPDSVTSIGNSAFSSCDNLTSITIPDSVTSIGNSAFSYCDNLTSVTIPDSVTSIGNYAFSYCSNLTSITIPGSVTSIGNSAFYNCSNLTSITIPDSVTSIGNYAFYSCDNLTSVTIGNGVTEIGYDAFKDCYNLTSVYISNLEAWCNIDFNSNTSHPLYLGAKLYLNGSLVTDLVIPDSVTSIGNYAFYNYRNLTSVTIGNGVTEIGKEVFKDCYNLTSVYISNLEAWCNIDFNSKTSHPLYLGAKLYLNGSLVTDLVIPDSVTSIGSYAFYNCSNLTSVTIPDSVTSIDWDAFSDCYSLTSVTIGNGVTSIGNSAFYNCSNLTSITIPDNVTSIGNYAFYNCSNLTSVIIPDSVTRIGERAFGSCDNLTSVTFENTSNWYATTSNFLNSYAHNVTDTAANARFLKDNDSYFLTRW